jgi:hypothetical protein
MRGARELKYRYGVFFEHERNDRAREKQRSAQLRGERESVVAKGEKSESHEEGDETPARAQPSRVLLSGKSGVVMAFYSIQPAFPT